MARVLVVASYAESLINFRGPLIADLVGKGHDVITCAPIERSDVRERIERLGARFAGLAMARTGTNPLQDLNVLWQLARMLIAWRPDVVLAYTAKPVIYTSIACALTGIGRCTSIITGLGYAFIPAQSLRHRLVACVVRTLYRLALRSNAVVFFQNPDDLALFIHTRLLADPRKAVLLNGSGVDLDYFRVAPLPPGPPSFLLIGRLIKEKGIEEYVEAARLLRDRHPAIKLFLLGPFDAHPSAITSAAVGRWVASGAIEYLGEAQDVRPYIARATVFVLPSYREGTPRTVLEAMAMGRPIVTTNVPGCKQTVVEGENGYLVAPRDPIGLARAMERFVTDEGLASRLGKRSRQKVELEYDVRDVNMRIVRALALER